MSNVIEQLPEPGDRTSPIFDRSRLAKPAGQVQQPRSESLWILAGQTFAWPQSWYLSL
jgi:hypothetical protein